MVKLYLFPMENYYLIPVADEELVYLPVLLARPSRDRCDHAFTKYVHLARLADLFAGTNHSGRCLTNRLKHCLTGYTHMLQWAYFV